MRPNCHRARATGVPPSARGEFLGNNVVNKAARRGSARSYVTARSDFFDCVPSIFPAPRGPRRKARCATRPCNLREVSRRTTPTAGRLGTHVRTYGRPRARIRAHMQACEARANPTETKEYDSARLLRSARSASGVLSDNAVLHNGARSLTEEVHMVTE